MNSAKCWVMILGFVVTMVAAHAAVDCSRARSNSEKLVCSNRSLLLAEELMAMSFRQAIHRGNDPKLLMESQGRWIREVRDVCNDAACMLQAYERRAAELDNQ
ncbi:MAG: lysozyme inhibitor LprI family protein [Burkholderiales bacterium]